MSYLGDMSTKSSPANSPLFYFLLTDYDSDNRNRRTQEESGPFGRRRNARYDHARYRARTGTPAKRENPNVAEFSRLFSQQQEDKQQQQPSSTSSSSSKPSSERTQQADRTATECVLYGYKNKDSEWKVIDKFERISQGLICEDYPRADTNMANGYTGLLGGGDVVIRSNMTPDANHKSKRYAGGFHWIKVTFDSRDAADRAMFYAPQDINGCYVFCRLYEDKPVLEDIPLPIGAPETEAALQVHARSHPYSLMRTNTAPIAGNTTSTNPFFQSRDVSSSKDRLFPSRQSFFGGTTRAEDETSSTGTASSTTATGFEPSSSFSPSSIFQRRTATGNTPEKKPRDRSTTYMSHNPSIRRAELRPINEALPPQPTLLERFFRSIPILSWFTGDMVGDGPQLREDGSFDYEKSNVYWRFWYSVDRLIGTDICGLREES